MCSVSTSNLPVLIFRKDESGQIGSWSQLCATGMSAFVSVILTASVTLTGSWEMTTKSPSGASGRVMIERSDGRKMNPGC